MPKRRKLTSELLKNHPYCCFCGGGAANAVIDARASADHGSPGAEAKYSTAVRIRSGKLRAPSFTFSCAQMFATVL